MRVKAQKGFHRGDGGEGRDQSKKRTLSSSQYRWGKKGEKALQNKRAVECRGVEARESIFWEPQEVRCLGILVEWQEVRLEREADDLM